MKRIGTLSVLAAGLILIAATRITYTFWPPTWPDEALFSSPAAELAQGRAFSTPVLAGLVPGMEEATLWNSPLFMVMLAGVYKFTGESQLAGRSLSLVLGFAVLVLFAWLARATVPNKAIALTLPMLLALDLPFIRAANTIRMDMLTLVWVLACLACLLQFRKNELPRILWAGLAGVAAGLGAISHPAAVLLVPMLFLFLLPNFLAGTAAAAGMVVGFLPWVFYIAAHYDLFRVQFLAQLVRKSSIVSLFGGDTGGIFVVYASQYGNRYVMVLVFLASALVLGHGIWTAIRTAGWNILDTQVRWVASVCIIFALILFMSEGWYIVYMTPLLLLLAGQNFAKDWMSRVPLMAMIVLILVSLTALFVKSRIATDVPTATAAYEKSIAGNVMECSSIYLRVRPDPYFVLRRELPRLELLEFIPGKLVFPNNEAFVRAKYDSIHCFLLDDNASWEPILSRYLEEYRHQFIIRRFARPPLIPSSLWVRNVRSR